MHCRWVSLTVYRIELSYEQSYCVRKLTETKSIEVSMRRACLVYEPFFLYRAAVSLIVAGPLKGKAPVGTITCKRSLSIVARGSCWIRQNRRWASSGSSVKLRFDNNLVNHLINLKR